MLKWVSNFFHWLGSPTAGAHISGLKARAEGAYNAKLAAVEQAYAKDLLVVEEFAHCELDALQHIVAHAHDRIAALLDADVDMGDRNGDAALLHLNLTKAAGN